VSVKKKKKPAVFEPKNFIVVAIGAIFVILVAMTMRMVMPKEKENSSFDKEVWQSSAAEATLENTSEEPKEDDNGLIAVNPPEAVPTTAAAVPKEAESKDADNSASSGYIPPVGGAVTADYSGEELVYSITMQDWRTHNGIDFAAEEGLDILSVADGTVEAVTESGLMGKTVIILHSGGVRSIYSNLSNADIVKAGDSVMQGSVIGKAGSTAAAEVSEPPHIHFEMSLNEEPVNPHDYIKIE